MVCETCFVNCLKLSTLNIPNLKELPHTTLNVYARHRIFMINQIMRSRIFVEGVEKAGNRQRCLPHKHNFIKRSSMKTM